MGGILVVSIMIFVCLFCKKTFQSSPCKKRKYCSRKCYNEIPRTPESIAKGAAKRTGKPHPTIQQENHYAWKGDAVGRDAVHKWVIMKLGKPEKCEYCGRDGLKGKFIHWANKSQEYKRDLTDWIRLCTPCHSRYDHSHPKSKYNQEPVSLPR